MKISFKDLESRIITDFVEEKDGVIYTICHLKNKIQLCPCCDKKVTLHSFLTHTFYDLPIQNKPVLISLTKRKYLCRNKNCDCKTFSDKTDFINPKGRKTKRLIKNIVVLTKDMNSIQTSKNLKELVIIAKKSAICNY